MQPNLHPRKSRTTQIPDTLHQLGGLQTIGADTVNLVINGKATVVKYITGGNFDDLGLISHLRQALKPEVHVHWKPDGKFSRIHLSSKDDVRVFFNYTLGRKLGLIANATTFTGDSNIVAISLPAGGKPVAADYPVDAHANLRMFYVARRTETHQKLPWTLLTQFYPTKLISDCRINVMMRYIQNFNQSWNELKGESTTLHLLDSDFELLKSFNYHTGRAQIAIDIQ